MATTIGIALFDGAEELDWAGPWEVLAAWAEQFPDDGGADAAGTAEDDRALGAHGATLVPA